MKLDNRAETPEGRFPAEPARLQAEEWTRSMTGLVASISVLALLLILPPVMERNARTERVQHCLAGSAKSTRIDGVVRLAGNDLFVYSDRWKLIRSACNGKGRPACRTANPGIAALEDNIGRAVSVELCQGDVVAYTVAGQRYAR